MKLLGLLRRGLGWRGVGIRPSSSELAKRARAIKGQYILVEKKGELVPLGGGGGGRRGWHWVVGTYIYRLEDEARISHSWPEAR